jgi:hypothetical protein
MHYTFNLKKGRLVDFTTRNKGVLLMIYNLTIGGEFFKLVVLLEKAEVNLGGGLCLGVGHPVRLGRLL